MASTIFGFDAKLDPLVARISFCKIGNAIIIIHTKEYYIIKKFCPGAHGARRGWTGWGE
jgi:hypothetical protein